MRTYIVTIVCLGRRYAYPALAPHACDAIMAALDCWPQACRVSARRVTGLA